MADTPQNFITNTRKRFLKMYDKTPDLENDSNFPRILTIAQAACGLSTLHLMQGHPWVKQGDIYQWTQGNDLPPKRRRQALLKTIRGQVAFLLTPKGKATAFSWEKEGST